MHPAKNTLPDNSRKAIIDLLQKHPAGSVDFASQAKQAHWKVKDTSFIALHELFTDIVRASDKSLVFVEPHRQASEALAIIYPR